MNCPTKMQLDGIEYHISEGMSYPDFLLLQKQLTQEVLLDSKKKIIIITNHPLVITNGRGDRQNAELGLTSVTPAGIEFHQIKRGGGFTFHAPNQMIVYPIMKLSPEFGLNDYLCWLQKKICFWVKEQVGIELEYRRNPLGLWYQGKKLASFGIGIERFVTNHGVALNVEKIPEVILNLPHFNPCGLGSSVYSSLAEVTGKDLKVSQFISQFNFMG